MPKTWFRPQIDGPRVGEAGRVDENEIDKIHKRFILAIDAVYNLLKPSYNGALDLYGVRNKLKQWISKKIPPGRSLHDGLIFVALDYFYSHRFKSDKDLSLTTRPAQIYFYLRQRRADHMVLNSHLLLSYMTTANLIPEKWVPESLLIDPIEAEIKKIPEFKDVRIDINLALPPGGKLWIYQNFLENWKMLKNYIDAGRPWPIRLMANTSNPYENKSVIAYGYEDMGNGSGKIYVYDIDCPDREHTIRFKLDQNTLTLSESCRQSDYSSCLQGFFCENYSVVPPPHSRVSRFFYSIIPMKSIWHIMRFICLLWLWVKNLVYSLN
jgi:hypothetical protein